MSAYSRSARKHRIERRLQVAAPIAVIAVCIIALAIIVIRFRLALP